MKLIKPSFSIIEQQAGLEGVYKQIERVGRVSHKSEDRITENSAKTFVERMMKMKHLSTCEFGTVYLYIDYHNPSFGKIIDKYNNNQYSKCIVDNVFPNKAHISSNYRVLVENNWLDDLKYLCNPTEYHHKRYTVKFICDRGILAEFTRHRKFSFMAESSRYCNYSKGKFNNEITYICPCWLDYNKAQELTEIANKDNKEVYRMGHDESLSMEERRLCSFVYDMSNHEHGYLFQISAGWKPQEARAVLPNSLKTELVMTGFVDDWWGEYVVSDKSRGLIDQRIHGKFYTEPNNIDTKKYRIVEKGFFPLRCNKGAHPQAQELAVPLRETFINQKIW